MLFHGNEYVYVMIRPVTKKRFKFQGWFPHLDQFTQEDSFPRMSEVRK